MRVRSTSTPNGSGSRYRGFNSNEPIPIPGSMYIASTSYGLAGTGNPRMDLAYKSTITDDPSMSRDVYKAVTHVQNKASAFGGTITWSYLNKPSLAFYAYGNIMYQPNIPATTPNWGGLVDDLAQRVADRSGSAFMLLLTLKELGATVSMVKNPFGLLKHNWRAPVKRLSARTLASKGSDVWLEHLYGWKSMFSDITSFSKASYQAVKELSSQEVEEEALERFSATQVESGTLPVVYGYSANATTWRTWFTNHGTSANYYGCRIHGLDWKTTYRVSCMQGHNTARAASLTRTFLKAADLNTWHGLRDFLWEVAPFSFVIDWFVDLRCLWAPFNKRFITSTGANMIGHSIKSVCTYNADFSSSICLAARSGTIPGWYGLSPTGGSGCYQAVVPGCYSLYQRIPGFPSSTNPGSSFLNRGLTLSQWATSSALIAQRIL